jgi:hypothetical protein
MSGFLPDIASWALRGGASAEAAAGNANDDDDDDAPTAISEEEVRAKRMARLAAFENPPAKVAAAASDDCVGGGGEGATAASVRADEDGGARPMDVDDDDESPTTAKAGSAQKRKVKSSPPPSTSSSTSSSSSSSAASVDHLARLRRKKALLLRRVLLLTFGPDDCGPAPSCVRLSLDDDFDACDPKRCPSGVSARHVAELLTARLSLSPDSRELASTIPSQSRLGLVSYLGGCHRRAGEEARELRQQVAYAAGNGGGGGGKRATRDAGGEEEMCEMLEQIKVQVVSYAASSLMVPDLFELGNDAPLQLARCLNSASLDPASSITFDALGKNTSFYHCVCEELHSQGGDEFASVIGDVVRHITDSLSKVNSLLDEGVAVTNDGEMVGGGGMSLASALRELCTNKRAAAALAGLPSFLLPPANTPAANERVQTMNEQQLAMMRMMQAMRPGENPSRLAAGGGYLRRSGPALEKDTVLGLVLRLGLPTEGPSPASPTVTSAFSNAATRSRKDVSQITGGFQRQLELYQGKCNELVKQLVVAGEESRKRVSPDDAGDRPHPKNGPRGFVVFILSMSFPLSVPLSR